MGIESEYGLSYAFSAEELERRELEGLPPQIWGSDPASAISKTYELYLPAALPRAGSTSEFLGNGMRLYQDVGSHPEAAGAESTEVQDIIDGDLAADKLLWRALRDAYRGGAIRNFMLSRRVVDVNGTSWGRHENYRMDRELIKVSETEGQVSGKKMAALAPFLAVRPMMGGAGCLHAGEFWMGQKLVTAVDDFAMGTTRSKPLVNTRDEPHGTGFREHVVCVDFTSPHVTARNLRATSLALRMIEHGMAPDLGITYPNWAFFGRFVATDLSMSYAASINGKTMTGLDVHEEFLTRAYDMSDDMLSPAELRGREEWRNVYDRLKAVHLAGGEGNIRDRAERIVHAIDEHLAGYVDWADRFMHIGVTDAKQHFKSEDGITFTDTSDIGAKADIMYDLVGKGTGLNRKYVERLQTPQAAEYVDQSRVEHRILHAPATGRAALREKFLYEFAGDPNTLANWSSVGYAFPQYGTLKTEYHHMRDPVASEDPDLNRFMMKVRQAQPASIALYNARKEQDVMAV